MPTRRTFLQQSALVSLAPLVPAFLSRTALAADAKPDERVLVVIQLDGGNDGLNTIVPYADENYAQCRQELRIRPKDVLKLNDAIGLHSALKPVTKLFEDGQLAIVQGVGYPNPNRSHFESMAIWHHARLDSADHDGIGWLGRAADQLRRGEASAADSIFIGEEAVPVALRGRRSTAVSLEDEADLQLAPAAAVANQVSAANTDVAAFVQRSVADSFAAAKRFSETSAAAAGGSDGFPSSALGQKLRLISKLLKLGGGTRIYYASQSGYDTHAAQAFAHYRLLDELAEALKAFLDDLKAAKLDDRVVVLMFSEFGRRVQENASAGTDHGVAGPVFLAGAPVRGGLIGPHPSLTDLDQGDLKVSLDFRRLYATLLQHWLGADPQAILGQAFEPIDCLKHAG